ncbi:MAG: chemotaxis protein CheW [Cyanobacteria bacterium P01_G01_bin.39]
MNQEYFTFELASSIQMGIALDSMRMASQFELQNICTVPGVANFWYGVVNYKGSLLWVLDSDRFFNIPTQKGQRLQKLTAVILKPKAEYGQKQVAIVTKQLQGILAIEPSCLQPLTEHPPQLQQCCNAVAQTDGETVYLLDTTKFLEQLHQRSILITA